MSFPTTSVLDNFNRANETPLSGGGNWLGFATGYYTGGACNLTSNAITGASGAVASASYWTPSQSSPAGPDCEAFTTITTLPVNGNYIRMYVRAGLVGGDTAKPSGYFVQWTYNSGSSDSVYIIRDDGGAPTVLATVSQDLAVGDKLGISAIATVVTVYRLPSGGGWGSLGTYDTAGDGTKYSSAGLITVVVRDTTTRLDDFGGGTVVPATAKQFFGLM